MITHGHPDHIGGLTKGGQPVFPKARYVFGAAEFDFWKKGENVREARKFNRELYVKICVPLADRSTFIKPGDEVVPGIRAVDAFGHSPGLLAFHDRERGQAHDQLGRHRDALRGGDAAAGLHLDVDDDKDKAVATRKRILDMVATDEMLVAGYPHAVPGPRLCRKRRRRPIAGCRTAIR